MSKFKLKALQLLSTEQGAKGAGEVFEKEATPEEIELGVQLGLYEQIPEVTGDGETEDGDGGGEDNAYSQPLRANEFAEEGGSVVKNKKKGGKQK